MEGNSSRKMTGHGVGNLGNDSTVVGMKTFLSWTCNNVGHDSTVVGMKKRNHSIPDSAVSDLDYRPPSMGQRFRAQADAFRMFLALKCCGCIASVPSLALVLITIFLILLLIAGVPIAFLMVNHRSAALTSSNTGNTNVPENIVREHGFWPDKIAKQSPFKANRIVPQNISICHGFGFSCTMNPGHIVGTNNRCDGHTDCRDASDEFDCIECQTTFSCPSSTASKQKLCLRGEHICDGTSHCADATDEALYCQKDCDAGQLQCQSKGNRSISMCVPEEMICDGIPNCQNMDDEMDCTNCKDGALLCEPTKQCIPKWNICDGIKHCPNGIDEEGCDCTACSGIDKALCDGSKKVCIERRQICDGFMDCPRGEDELNCPGSCPTTTIDHPISDDSSIYSTEHNFAGKKGSMVTCSDGKMHPWSYACGGLLEECNGKCKECNLASAFQCSSSSNLNNTTLANGKEQSVVECIPKQAVCDGKRDCLDGSDEMLCNCDGADKTPCFPLDTLNTGFSEKRCFDNKSQRCDGYKDCPNGDDEIGCEDCSEDAFRCKSTARCIPKLDRCNGVEDCDDGSDEQNCTCKECSVQPVPMYKCTDADRCFPLSVVCEPRTRCPSKLDKLFCSFRRNPQTAYRLI